MSIRRIVPLDQARWSVAPPPAWRLSREVDWGFRAPADEAVVWLLLDEQHHVASQAVTRRWVRQLQTIAAVQALAQVEIEFEPDAQALVVHELVVWRFDADGAWRKRTPVTADAFLLRQREQQLEQQILHGRVSLVALLEDVRVGDVVDLSWTVEPYERLPDFPFAAYFAFAWSVPLAQSFFTLHLADAVPVRWKLHPGGDGPQPERRDAAGLSEWSLCSPPRFDGEDNVPGSHWHWPLLEVSGWDSWQAVASGVSGLWTDALLGGAAEVAAEAARLAADTTPEQAILNAIRFVQEEVRYLAVDFGHGAGLLPSGAGSVLQRRFGDCKDKSVLLTALLRALGVDAWPVLVASRWRMAVIRLLPSAQAFDHAIVGFEWQGARHYVDPTLIGQRGDLGHRVPPPYGVGLDLAPNVVALSELPPAQPATLALVERFELDRRGNGHVTQTFTFDGFFVDEVRSTLLRDGRPAFAKRLAETLQQHFPAIAMEAGETNFDDDVDANVLRIEARHALPTWGKPGDRPPPMFIYGAYGLLLGLDRIGERETRRQPWMLRYPMQLRHHVIVRGRCVHRVKSGCFEHEGPGFHYRREMKSKRHEASFDHAWRTTSAAVSAAEWPAYRREREVALEQTGIQVDTQGMTLGRGVRMGVGVLIALVWGMHFLSRIGTDGPALAGDTARASMMRDVGEAFEAHRRGDVARAYALAAPHERHYRDNLEAQILLAESALLTGHADAAEEALKRARRLDPENPLVVIVTANLHELRGDFATARQLLETLVERPDVPPKAFADLARVTERSGDRAAARTAWEQLLQRQPAHPEGLYGLAHLLWLDGERARADRLIIGAVRSQPMPSAVLESVLARYFASTGRPVEALDAARRAAELAPDEPATVRQHVMARMNAGDHSAAATMAQEMTRRFPDDALAWSALAISSAVAGDLAAAAPAFDRWTELAPDDPEAVSSFGYFLHLEGNDARAREVLAKGTRRFPAYGNLWLNYAVVLETLGDPHAHAARDKANALMTVEQRATLAR